jgi:hypothetical protein
MLVVVVVVVIIIVVVVVVEANLTTRKQEWIFYCIFVTNKRSRLNEGRK